MMMKKMVMMMMLVCTPLLLLASSALAMMQKQHPSPCPHLRARQQSEEAIHQKNKKLEEDEESRHRRRHLLDSAERQRSTKCTTDSEGARYSQTLMDAWCARMGFTENGEKDGPPACITVATQDLTDEQEKCKDLPFGSQEIVSSCMGPLKMLVGTWKGSAGKVYTPLPSYGPMIAFSQGDDPTKNFADNAGLVPGNPTSTMVAIKNQTYEEVVTFKPIFEAVRNRGYADADPINAECQMNQFFVGVKYSLKVFQSSPTDPNGKEGNLLHEETGMWLYNQVPASGGGDGYDVVRQSVVPHGVSFTAVGSVEEVSLGAATMEELIKRQTALPGTIFNEQGPAPLGCTPADGYDTEGFPWGSTTNGTSQGGSPPYLVINDFLVNETRKQSVTSFVELRVSTESFSETPFLQRQATGTNFTNMMYIETLEDGSLQLQYFQRAVYMFQQRFDCLNCEGVTRRNSEGCMIGCAGLDREVPFPNGTSMGTTLNDYFPLQAGKCYSCEPTDFMEGSEGGTCRSRC